MSQIYLIERSLDQMAETLMKPVIPEEEEKSREAALLE